MTRNSSSPASAPGIGFAELLAIAFIVLKLTHEVGWSWWWVLAPLWGGLAVAAVIVLVMLAVAGVIALVARH